MKATTSAKPGDLRAKYGADYYSRIGKRGGVNVREKLGSDFYSRIGTKGGETTLRRHGREQFRAMGKKAHGGVKGKDGGAR